MEAPEARQSGAILVLALIFLVVGSFVVIPLAGLATTNLQNTAPFISIRQTEFAADGAMDLAIETVRYSPVWGYPPNGPCGPIPISPSALNGQTLSVACQSNPPTTGESRNVTFWVCSGTTATPNCAGSLLEATADYSDFTPSGTVQVGYAVRILSWEISSADS